MAVVIAVSSSERRGYKCGDDDECAEVSPLEDIEGVAWGFQGTESRGRLDELIDSFDYCEGGEEA